MKSPPPRAVCAKHGPSGSNDQPANFRVLKLATAGLGEALRDNAADIDAQLATLNESRMPAAPGNGEPAQPGGVDVTANDGACSLALNGKASGRGVGAAAAALGVIVLLGLRRRSAR